MNEIIRLSLFLVSAISCAITLREIGGAIQRVSDRKTVVFWDNVSKAILVLVVILNILAYATQDYVIYAGVALVNARGWYYIYELRG